MWICAETQNLRAESSQDLRSSSHCTDGPCPRPTEGRGSGQATSVLQEAELGRPCSVFNFLSSRPGTADHSFPPGTLSWLLQLRTVCGAAALFLQVHPPLSGHSLLCSPRPSSPLLSSPSGHSPWVGPSTPWAGVTTSVHGLTDAQAVADAGKC